MSSVRSVSGVFVDELLLAINFTLMVQEAVEKNDPNNFESLVNQMMIHRQKAIEALICFRRNDNTEKN